MYNPFLERERKSEEEKICFYNKDFPVSLKRYVLKICVPLRM